MKTYSTDEEIKIKYFNYLLFLKNFNDETGKDLSTITEYQSKFIEHWYWASIL